MKLFVYSILFVVATLQSVNAAIAVRVVFHKGLTAAGITCTPTEWDKLEAAMDKGCLAGRRLGETTHSRRLNYCQTICKDFPPGMCYLSGTGCRNRRTLQEPASDEALPSLAEPETELPTRSLQWEGACSSKKKRIGQELTAVQNSVGPMCKTMISAIPPEYTCYDV
jgi:hypothetical protein